jgi:hypothetical protein
MGLPLWRDLPPEGVSAGLVTPYCDSQAMSEHLLVISAQVEPGAHAILLLDQAGWHISQSLETATNLTLLTLTNTCCAPKRRAADIPGMCVDDG